MKYDIKLTPDDNDTLLVTFPDFPDAVTFGEDEQDAIFQAQNALTEVIAARIANREDIPEPKSHPNFKQITLPPEMASIINAYKKGLAHSAKEVENFDFQGADIVAGMAKGILGLIPHAGPALAEVVGEIIPNQRMDRVIQYLNFLKSNIDEETLRKIKEFPDKIALFEEGMHAAGITPYSERLKRISYVVANGLNREELDVDHQSSILNITSQLNKAQAVILNYYGHKGGKLISMAEKEEFQSEHPEIWPSYPKSPDIPSSDAAVEQYGKELEEYDYKQARLKHNIKHLESLTLLEKLYTNNNFSLRGGGRSGDNQKFNQIEDAINGLTNSKYNISLFGLEVLHAIKKPYIEG